MTRRGLRSLLVVVFVVLAFCLCAVYALFLKPVKAEEMSLATLDAEVVNLDSLVRDRMTVLNFWATWCGPCIREMPLLDSVRMRLDPNRWQMFLVSEESAEKINAFRQKRQFQIPYLRHLKPLREIGNAVIPKTIVLDPHGKVVYAVTGELNSSVDDLYETLMALDVE